jgi:hypothetical protein
VRHHRHRFQDAGAGVRLPDSDLPGRGPPDKSQRALAAAGFVDGPDFPLNLIGQGLGWLVKERRPTLSFEIFERLVRHGVPGLCITRQFPERVRHEHGLTDVRIIWLSATLGEDYIDPHNLNTLSNLIARFLNERPNGVILLDGLEYLIINNDFPRILHFVEYVIELIMLRQAIILLPVSPRTLEEKELAMLERNLMVFEG